MAGREVRDFSGLEPRTSALRTFDPCALNGAAGIGVRTFIKWADMVLSRAGETASEKRSDSGHQGSSDHLCTEITHSPPGWSRLAMWPVGREANAARLGSACTT